MTSSGSEYDDVDLCHRSEVVKQREAARRRMAKFCVHSEVREYCEQCASMTEDGSGTMTSSMSEASLPVDGMRLQLGKNKSFTAFEVREIERNNANLVKKIASHNRRPSKYRTETVYNSKVWNSQVNRKKKQQQIDRENMILLRKIQGVKGSGLSNWKKA